MASGSNIGNQTGFNGSSMALNGSKNESGQKPKTTAGGDDPGGHKPKRVECKPVPLAK